MTKIIIGFIIVVGLFLSFILGKSKAQKSLLPLLDANRDLQAKADAVPEIPQYRDFPGTTGVFLGRFRSTIGKGFDYDLYFNDSRPQVVFARYGNDGSDFIMHALADLDEPVEPLAEALSRVYKAGLYSA